MSRPPLSSAALPIGLLASVSFLSNARTRVVDPLLAPIAVDCSASLPQVAILVSAFSIPYGLNQLVLGPLGDRVGKMKVILGALAGYTVFTAGCAFADGLTQLTVLRVCAGAASGGLIPTGIAYIADHVPYDDRQVAITRFLAGVVTAQIVVAPLAGLFADSIGWRGVFLVLAALAAGALAILGTKYRSLPAVPPAPVPLRVRTLLPSAFGALLRDRLSRQFLLVSAVDGVLLSGCFPFVAPYLHDRLDLNFFASGVVLATFGLGALVFLRTSARLVATLGERGMILGGGLLLTAGALLAASASRWPVIVLVQFLFGIGYFMFHTVLQARATEMMPAGRSTAVSAFVFALFLGQAAGAAVMGALIGAAGFRPAFLAQGIGILGLTGWAMGLLRTRPA